MVMVRELFGKNCIGCSSVYPHECNCNCRCLTEWSIHVHALEDYIQITSNNSVSKEPKTEFGQYDHVMFVHSHPWVMFVAPFQHVWLDLSKRLAQYE